MSGNPDEQTPSARSTPLARELSELASDGELAKIEQQLRMAERQQALEMTKLEADAAIAGLNDQLRNATASSIFGLLERFEYLTWHDEDLHSKMLEFLLKPGEAHGLRSALIKKLVQKASGKFLRGGAPCEDPDVSGELLHTSVRREERTEEHRRIDLKIRDERRQFVLLVENKLRAPESLKQFSDYWEDAKRKDPDFAIAGLLLSPDGRESKTASGFPVVPLSYKELVTILEECIGCELPGNPEVAIVSQYKNAIRRWFMEDPKLKSLAWRLHSLYPHALEYLNSGEALPHRQISDKLNELIKTAMVPMAPFDRKPKATATVLVHYFVPEEWEGIPFLQSGSSERDPHPQGRLLVFWFGINSEPSFSGLALFLAIRPTAKNPEGVEALFRAIRSSGASPGPENLVNDKVQSIGWTTVWAKVFATQDEIKPGSDGLFPIIEKQWLEFVETDLRQILKAVEALHLHK